MSNKYNWNTIGQRIRKARELAGLSQGELGEKISYGYQMIGKWERGETRPNLDSLFSLCDVFNCEIGYLLCEYNSKTREFADIQAVTGLSECAISSISHVGEKNLKDGYYALSGGIQKKLLNAFLESEEFRKVMLQLQLHYALATGTEAVPNTPENEFTGVDLEKAEQVAEAVGSVILKKEDAAEFQLSIATDMFKQFARKAVEKRSGE